MIRAINILGFLLLIGPFAFSYLSESGFSLDVFSISLFGFALLAIPAGYKLSPIRVFGWLLIFIAIYIFIQNNNFISFLAFIMFAISGRIAGLPFEAGDGD